MVLARGISGKMSGYRLNYIQSTKCFAEGLRALIRQDRESEVKATSQTMAFPPSPPGMSRTFYKRELKKPSIEFASPAGKEDPLLK